MINNKKDFIRQYKDKCLQIPPISQLKAEALKEKEEEIQKETEEILALQINEVKKAMKNNKNYCYWISFIKLNLMSDTERRYSIEAENRARQIFEKSGYTITQRRISWTY